MFGCVLGYGEYREEALTPVDAALDDRMGSIQLLSRDFDAAIKIYQQLFRLRLGFSQALITALLM